MIDEVGDIRRVLSRETGLGQWLRTFRSAGAYKFYRSSDKKLLPWICLMFIRRTAGKIRRSLPG